jgi:hypothetical protein
MDVFSVTVYVPAAAMVASNVWPPLLGKPLLQLDQLPAAFQLPLAALVQSHAKSEAIAGTFVRDPRPNPAANAHDFREIRRGRYRPGWLVVRGVEAVRADVRPMCFCIAILPLATTAKSVRRREAPNPLRIFDNEPT